jgi:hypothetical protein
MSNQTRLRTETIPATGALNNVGVGNFFMLVSSGSAVNVTFIRGGSTFGAENVQGGYVKACVEEWERCSISGTPGASVSFFIGFENIAEDSTDYRRTVGEFQQLQPATISDAADVDVGSSAVAVQVAPANAARASVTFTNLEASVAYVRIGAAATVAANRGQRLAPGQSFTSRVRGAIHAIRESAAAALVSVSEENF